SVAPEARVLLGVPCVALTSTFLRPPCLAVRSSPRGLACGLRPRAAQLVPAGPGYGALSLQTARRALSRCLW
uniref:Uncharacterized protein n=1 Tax=Monodon monoceros TaxID=40151 RepID=A0A8C6AYQ0_MONMO